jgi:hypothetical protein
MARFRAKSAIVVKGRFVIALLGTGRCGQNVAPAFTMKVRPGSG